MITDTSETTFAKVSRGENFISRYTGPEAPNKMEGLSISHRPPSLKAHPLMAGVVPHPLAFPFPGEPICAPDDS